MTAGLSADIFCQFMWGIDCAFPKLENASLIQMKIKMKNRKFKMENKKEMNNKKIKMEHKKEINNKKFKMENKRRYGTDQNLFESYFSEYCWRVSPKVKECLYPLYPRIKIYPPLCIPL
jgi:predicted Holliday junction resolvase-like endonuclease